MIEIKVRHVEGDAPHSLGMFAPDQVEAVASLVRRTKHFYCDDGDVTEPTGATLQLALEDGRAFYEIVLQ